MLFCCKQWLKKPHLQEGLNDRLPENVQGARVRDGREKPAFRLSGSGLVTDSPTPPKSGGTPGINSG
ncbi:MAG TPA: hypothetical protein DCF44_08200 [Chitinophagaceae bacterium]|nr:hypothetical protein [Chitinophagaceae bacterium]